MNRTPPHIIAEKARGFVDSYKFAQERNCHWALSLTNLATATAQEYQGRFLIELIQNGYDAHLPQTTNGEIQIRYEPAEPPHGVLYVANTGRPFTESNFNAICEIAQSDKQPGRGIGNKGVGFRSVLQICRSPQVFSRAAEGAAGSFDGFCFGFATDEDYDRLAGGDIGLAKALRRDVSPYFLPVPLAGLPPLVAELAKTKVQTVIRMPLDNDDLKGPVTKALEMLVQSPCPVLLFLDRLAKLLITTPDEHGGTITRLLTRHAELLAQLADRIGDSAHRVRVDESVIVESATPTDSSLPHSLGDFLVVTRVTESARLKSAIHESIKAGQLDERFAGWTEDAEVSAAVRIDGKDDTRHLYTFLPMGDETLSPFAGHLNAPFVTKLARLDLAEKVKLNELFFDVAAELSASVLLVQRDLPPILPRTVSLDLISWCGPDSVRLLNAFKAIGKDLPSEVLVPVVERTGGAPWASLKEAWTWQHDYQVLTAGCLAGVAGAPLIAPEAGADRTTRLEEFVGLLGLTLQPGSTTVADWAEAVAQSLHDNGAALASWDAFYSDLARHFANDGKTLAGRKLLIDGGNVVRRCGPYSDDDVTAGHPAVFFPPAKDRTEEDEEILATISVDIPDSLAKYVCYMNDGLSWYASGEGPQRRRTPAREFLQKAGLVLRYETRSVVEHLATVGRRTRSEGVRKDLLGLVYRLHRAARAKEGLDLAKLGFEVPTRGGWRPAGQAFFSAGWPGTLGERLERLARENKEVAPSLVGVEERLLVPPTSEPFRLDEGTSWVEFCRALGVRDGLWPEAAGAPKTDVRGRILGPEYLARTMGLSEFELGLLREALAKEPPAAHPDTGYAVGQGYKLPGQAEYTQLLAPARELYARLICESLSAWPEDCFAVAVGINRKRNPDHRLWPTPLQAFLKHASWMPVLSRGASTSLAFVPPSQAWDTGGDDPPRFFPLVGPEIRALLRGNSACRERLVRQEGLQMLEDPRRAGKLLRRLGQIFDSGELEESQTPAFRKLYEAGWSRLDVSMPNPFAEAEGSPVLVVSQGPRLVGVQLSAPAEGPAAAMIYVQDTTDGLRSQVLYDLGYRVLDVGAKAGQLASQLLRPCLGGRLRPVSEVHLEILGDGEAIVPATAGFPLITDATAWLSDLVALVIAIKSRDARHRTDAAHREVQRKLRSIRIRCVRDITVRLEGEESTLPEPCRGALPLAEGDTRLILLQSHRQTLDWASLERIAGPIAQLVGRDTLEADLRLAMVELRRRYSVSGELPDSPNDADLRLALAVSEDELRRARFGLRTRVSNILEHLYPIVFHYAGPEAASCISPDNENILSEDAVVAAIQPVASQLPCSPSDLVRECRTATSIHELRDRLGIGFADFNATLAKLAPRYQPRHNTTGHEEAMRLFKTENRGQLVNALRHRFLAAYRRGDSLEAYVMARDLGSLGSDPKWLDLYELPTPEMLRQHAEVWLQGLGTATSADAAELPPIDQVRGPNTRQVRSVLSRATPVVRAWCHRSGIATPEPWKTADAAEALGDRLDATGRLDFEVLQEAEVLLNLVTLGLWPTDMPQTLDVAVLHLTAEDLRAAEDEAEMARKKEARERRSITFGGRQYSCDAEERVSLVDAVRKSISAEFLATSPVVADLEAPEPRGPTQPGAKRPKKPPRRPRLTDEQKQLIGLVGEVVALEWIRKHHPRATEDCWVSTNHDLVIGGDGGDDDLGYDFDVPERGGLTRYEVKATTGDDCVMELGPTEVQAAQRSKGDRYRILFIRNVLDPDGRTVAVLPNPFGEAGRGLFEAIGAGLRFRFLLQNKPEVA
jgi:hypothetical protein